MAAIHRSDLFDRCRNTLLRVGADPQDARVLSEATVEAELVGNRAVGVGHLFDYLDGYRKGRIALRSRPVVRRVAPAVIDVDAQGGLAHLGTNPIAFGVPRPGLQPVVIDQASSATAFVNVRRAAEAGQPIPAGWALGPDGEGTQDATAALRGTLLPFGGHRGGNIALLVEILATLSGGCFSIDAPPFDEGAVSPGIGVFLLAVDPSGFSGSLDRLTQQLESLHTDHDVRPPAVETISWPDSIEISADALQRLKDASRPR